MIHVYLDPIDAFGRVLRALRDAPLEPHVEAVEAILEEIVIFFVSKNWRFVELTWSKKSDPRSDPRFTDPEKNLSIDHSSIAT